MTGFLACLAVMTALMLLELAALVLTAPEGWEDENGFHLCEIDFTHGEVYTK